METRSKYHELQKTKAKHIVAVIKSKKVTNIYKSYHAHLITYG